MADNDVTLIDQATTPKTFKPDLLDAGNGVRRARHSLADTTGATVNPATVEAINSLKDAVTNLANTLLTDTKLRASPVPVSGSLSVSGVMTDATGQAIKNAIQALNDFSESIFTSADGNTVYFRRVFFKESDDSFTITWTDISGATIAAPVGAIPLKSNASVTSDIHYYDAVASGTGYSLGNVIARIVLLSLATGLPTSTIYYNLSTSAVVLNPVLGDLILQEQRVKATIVSLPSIRPPLIYSQVTNSPFTLTSSWRLVATTTANTKGLRIAPVVNASTYDIEWASVAAGASAPTDTIGEPILGGDDFASGLPIGDIYLKSASGQVALVKVGV